MLFKRINLLIQLFFALFLTNLNTLIKYDILLIEILSEYIYIYTFNENLFIIN